MLCITGLPWDPCALTRDVKAGAGYVGKKYNYEGSYQKGQGYDHKGTISQGKYEIPERVGFKKPGIKGYGKGCYTW